MLYEIHPDDLANAMAALALTSVRAALHSIRWDMCKEGQIRLRLVTVRNLTLNKEQLELLNLYGTVKNV